MLVPALAIPLLFLARPFANGSAGEGLYLRFIVFYALVFPAYVLLFMRGGKAAQPGLGLRFAAIAVILASMPLHELGFLHHRAWLLAIPLATLFALRLITSRAARGKTIEARLT
jgi:hypothetical protein